MGRIEMALRDSITFWQDIALAVALMNGCGLKAATLSAYAARTGLFINTAQASENPLAR